MGARFTVPETLGYIARIGAVIRVDCDGALVVEPAEIPAELESALRFHGAQLVRYVESFPCRTWPAEVVRP